MTAMPEYVWLSRGRYHRTIGCYLRRHGTKEKTKKVRLSTVGMMEPCRICFPEVPRTVRRACETCSPLRLNPCEHNGGIPVKRGNKTHWTWPERVAHKAKRVVYGHSYKSKE